MSTARQEAEAPRTTIPRGYGKGEIASSDPPPLPPRLTGEDLAPDRRYLPPIVLQPSPRLVPQNLAPPPPPVTRTAPRVVQPVPAYTSPPIPYPEPLPSIVEQPGANERPTDGLGSSGSAASDRVEAGRLINPSLTVPLGTIIPAVLETALDSTRAGSVRALVQRDVRSFDGSRVLIPRGSRLYGSYEGALAEGQNRALVTWTRLLRPDGVTIALDSQASDPLGRAGIRGKVDSKFLQRFGGAILQSVLDIGVGLATRSVTDGVIVALPGSTQNVSRAQPSQITPTLKVKHGTSVSVYVSRDLDFSSVE
ncbi:TrbI/VirB10 family protein [Qipengyuania sediminis]|uniref:TrbI/VirB10 family protein n=1 Tax=Qipengyuania sediminis TaxID=1532023 RepID=UPI001F0D5A46|nr:TrbI/VirB10 family protein [Qipengyuania sediminis]